MLFEGFIGEDAGGTDFDKVSAEFAFKHPVLLPAEIDMVMGGEHFEVFSAGIVLVKTDTAVTGDAPVHFMIDQGTEVLVAEGSFVEAVPPVIMTGHHRHILKVAFAAFVAGRTVVRMVGHQAFDDVGSELFSLGIDRVR